MTIISVMKLDSFSLVTANTANGIAMGRRESGFGVRDLGEYP